MKTFLLLFVLFAWVLPADAATYYTFNGGSTTGIWGNASTWTTDPSGSTQTGAAVPATGDAVVILNGYTVTHSANVGAENLRITIQQGGVLDMGIRRFPATGLSSLDGQGLLRLSSALFPTVATNNFDDAGTGTVEYYNLPSPTALPTAVTQYNNLRLVNSTATNSIITQDAGLTVQGTLVLQRTGTGSLTYNLTGTVPLTLVGDLTVGAGTTLGLSGGGAHAVTVSGNITVENTGTLDLLNNGAGTAANNTTFTGTADRTLANSGTTRLNAVVVNKGVGQQFVQSITSTVGATLSINSAVNAITLTNGTLRLGSNITLATLSPNTNGNNGYIIPASAGLWIDGATVSLPSGVKGGLISLGLFRITAGSFTSNGNDGTVIGDYGSYIIEGGTLSAEKFSTVRAGNPLGSFFMSGGTMNIRSTGANLNNQKAFATFSLPDATQTYNVSGGVINVYNSEGGGSGSDSGVEIAAQAGNFSVTGGTFNIILPGTGDPFNNIPFKVASTAPFWNLNITKPNAGPAASLVSLEATVNVTAKPLTVLNVLSISGPNSPTLVTNNQNVTVQNHFNIGQFAIYRPGNNTTSFTGTQNHIFTVDGTVGDGTAAGAGLYNMVVDKPAGSLLLAGTASPFPQVRNELRIESGVLDDGGKQLKVLGNVVNSATHTSSGGAGSITLAGTVLQTLDGDGNGVFGNLTLDNGTLAAGAVAVQSLAAQAVSGKLLFNRNHVFDIGTHRLSITSISKDAVATAGGSIVFSANCLIRTAGNQSDGGLRKTFGSFSASNTEAFLYPVGTLVGAVSVYTPASIGITAQPNRYGKITVAPVKVQNPFVTAPASALRYYWKVTGIDFVGLPANSVTHQYSAPQTSGSLVSGTLTNYVAGYYVPTQWTASTDVNSVVEVGASTFNINFANVNIDGEYTAGTRTPEAFGSITAFYSRVSGDWEVGATWSTDPVLKHNGGPSATAPTASNPVFIGDGATYNHVVEVKANTARSGSLEIATGSTLNVGTFINHNFGSLPNAKVQGAGRLRISSATATAVFPGGDFGTFLGPQGGTVEYYTTGAQSFTLPAGAAQATYRNLEINVGPALNQTISLPALDLQVYENMGVGTLATFTGTANLSTVAAGNLSIDGNLNVLRGSLLYRPATAARTIAVGGDVRVDAGAVMSTTGAGTYALGIGGGVLNNGTFNMSGVPVTFTGTTNEAVTGTTNGAITNFSSLTVNKGASQTAVLTLDVTGTLTLPTPAAVSWLSITNGTFRFAKPNTEITLTTGNYTLASTAALQVDSTNSVVNVTTGGDLLLAGRIHARKGTLNVGTPGSAGINTIEYSGATDPVITVGTDGILNVTGQIRRPTTTTQGNLSYTQTGGTVTVYGNGSATAPNSTRAQLEVLNTGSYFGMSGGTLNLRRSNNNSGVISDLYLHPEASSVTGGTIVLGDASTAAGTFNLAVDTTVPLFNLHVEPGAGTTLNTATLMQNPLTLRGNLLIGNTRSVFNTNGLNVSVAGNFTNNNATANLTGDLTIGGYRAQTLTQTTTLNGSANNTPQLVAGISGTITNFGNLVVNNTGSNSPVQLQANTPLRVNNVLTLQAGNLADNGQTITAKGNVVNSAQHSSTGSGSIVLDGVSGQTVSGNNAGRFGNLTLTNASGATLLASQQVDDVLTFGASSGSLSIGSNLLRLANTSSGAVAGASAARFIQTNGIVADAGVEKAYPNVNGSSFLFPVGTGTKYTPATLNMTNTGGAAGTITVRPINLAHPATTSVAATELRYYWQVSRTGFGATPTVSHTYTYTDADVQGTESQYVAGRFQSGAWSMPAGSVAGNGVDAGTNSIVLTGVGFIDGDFTAGAAGEFNAVPIYYSRTAAQGSNGASWNVPTAWTFNANGTDSTPLPSAMPTAANPVEILAGHTINTNGSGRGAVSLKLDGTLNLGENTSNNFNTVTGTGRLVIASAIFPAGNYSAFTGPGGGTVEYGGASTNTSFTLTARPIYNNLVFSGTGIKTLSNANLTIGGSLLVSGGTVRNPSNVTLTMTSTSQDFTNQGTFELNNGALQIGRSIVNSSSGTLTLGTGSLSTGSGLTNSGTLTAGAGSLTIGTTLTNSGTYAAGSGSLETQEDLINTGTFNANEGAIDVGKSLTNTNIFQASNGDITVTENLTNSGTYTANSNILTVNGNFANNGGFNAGSGRITLQGNWSNSGTFTAGTSTVNFVSTSSRALSGSSATTFYKVNKTGSGSLVLSQNATVTDILALDNGNLVTGSNVLSLTNQTTQPIVGQSTSAYVSGRLAISFPSTMNTTRVYPVGNDQFYRPVTILQNGTGSNPVVLVEMINSAPSGSLEAGISNLSRLRHYAIRTLSGTIQDPTVRLSFNTNSTADEQVNVPGNLRIARSTSSTGPWTNAGGAGVFTPAAPAGNAVSGITTIGTNTFFALASTNEVDNPLPVELTRFAATAEAKTTLLAWATAGEKNSAFFEVQRSANGRTFEAIGRVAAQGNTTAPQRYKLRDEQPLSGLSYYRLRMVDADGTFSYSPVASVRHGNVETPATVQLYPNPATGTGFHLAATNLPAGTATVRVLDLLGHVLNQQVVDFGTADVAVPLARPLAKGLYVVTVQTGAGSFTQKLVVE